MLDPEFQIIKKDGLITQSLSGFYNVLSDDKIYVCKAKGLFRHKKLKPVVGDYVAIEIDTNDDYSEARIIDIYDRKNQLVRPPVANVDFAVLVMSLVEPEFSYQLLDQYLVSIEYQNITPVIVLTKFDLLCKKLGQEKAEEEVNIIRNIYEAIGYKVHVNNNEVSFVYEFIDNLTKGIYVVMGQSGVGKSTLLNLMIEDLDLKTNEISQSLNRGKHTTRQVNLYPLHDSLIADTPGFSSLELPKIKNIELRNYFPEIFEASQYCKFRSCSHIHEPGCYVKESVENGKISEIRYKSYCLLLERLNEYNNNIKY